MGIMILNYIDADVERSFASPEFKPMLGRTGTITKLYAVEYGCGRNVELKKYIETVI